MSQTWPSAAPNTGRSKDPAVGPETLPPRSSISENRDVDSAQISIANEELPNPDTLKLCSACGIFFRSDGLDYRIGNRISSQDDIVSMLGRPICSGPYILP